MRINESYVISNAAAFLYFVAGLLPDPEGPFHPSLAHRFAWVTGACLESSVLALSLRLRKAEIGVVNTALSCLKIILLLSMCITHVYLRSGDGLDICSAAEREGLLSNGNAEYGTNGNSPYKGKNQAPQSRGGWLDYFIGFRILFPYLW